MPHRPMTASPITRMPTAGDTTSAPWEAIGSATSTAIVTAAIRIAVKTASPDWIIHVVRRTGVVSTRSVRRRPSSLAQPATKNAPRSPRIIEANPAKASCRRPDGWVRSIVG